MSPQKQLNEPVAGSQDCSEKVEHENLELRAILHAHQTTMARSSVRKHFSLSCSMMLVMGGLGAWLSVSEGPSSRILGNFANSAAAIPAGGSRVALASTEREKAAPASPDDVLLPLKAELEAKIAASAAQAVEIDREPSASE